MAAVQEHRVDLAAEADVAIVERLLLLLKQIGKFFHLALQQDDLLAQKRVVFPLNLCMAATVHTLLTKQNISLLTVPP